MKTLQLAQLLRETAMHHGSFEAVAPPHDWWDWYAAYMEARGRGSNPEGASGGRLALYGGCQAGGRSARLTLPSCAGDPSPLTTGSRAQRPGPRSHGDPESVPMTTQAGHPHMGEHHGRRSAPFIKRVAFPTMPQHVTKQRSSACSLNLIAAKSPVSLFHSNGTGHGSHAGRRDRHPRSGRDGAAGPRGPRR